MNLQTTNSVRRIDLEADSLAPGKARDFVRTTLEDWGHRQLIDVVTLVVSELVANAVLHARSKASLTLLDHTDRVQVRVRDDKPIPPLRCDLPIDATHGRGLMLVDALADRWGVEPAPPGKIVWLDIAHSG